MAAASDKYKLMKDMLFDDFLSTASLEDLLDVPVFILKFVAKLTPEDQKEFDIELNKVLRGILFDDFLREAPIEQLIDVPVSIRKGVAKLTPEDQKEFNFERLFAKNIILFGGINQYVNDFFAKGTIEKILAMPSGDTSSLAKYLKKMDTYEDLSEENRARISSALERILPRGGARRHRSRRQRRQRRRAITRRRR
jgi:hypothetical protein